MRIRTFAIFLCATISLGILGQSTKKTTPTDHPTEASQTATTATTGTSAEEQMKAVFDSYGDTSTIGKSTAYTATFKAGEKLRPYTTRDYEGKSVNYLDVEKPTDIGWQNIKIISPPKTETPNVFHYQIGTDKGVPVFITLSAPTLLDTPTEPDELKRNIAKIANDPRVQQCSGARTCSKWCTRDDNSRYCCEYTCAKLIGN